MLLPLTSRFAVGQSPTPPQASTSPIQIGSVTIGGSIRTRVEGWNWFKAPGAENTYGFPGTLFRLSLSQQRRDLDWTFEVGAPILLGLPDNAIAPAPQGQLGLGASYFAANHNSRNAGTVFPKQVFVRFKRLAGKDAHSLQIGRFEFLDGADPFAP